MSSMVNIQIFARVLLGGRLSSFTCHRTDTHPLLSQSPALLPLPSPAPASPYPPLIGLSSSSTCFQLIPGAVFHLLARPLHSGCASVELLARHEQLSLFHHSLEVNGELCQSRTRASAKWVSPGPGGSSHSQDVVLAPLAHGSEDLL